ncbi:DUF4468 domain-containing protein [candidate division WOR-3 bacterium]|nr:DUF4468 domain-containing protein [candidate division WOR-3 bacterium]MCK4334527.1 DUF4468 domain-containing protein [candidate division WOR-3 bacterium]
MKRWIAYCIAPLLGIAGVVFVMPGCVTTGTILPPEQRIIQDVIEIEGKSQDELYVSCMKWMTKTFKSSKEVIQYQDKEAGTIVGKGYTIATDSLFIKDANKANLIDAIFGGPAEIAKPYLWFTMTLETKDGRVRITFDQIGWTHYLSAEPSNIETVKWFNAARPNFEPILEDLEAFLKQPEEEW